MDMCPRAPAGGAERGCDNSLRHRIYQKISLSRGFDSHWRHAAAYKGKLFTPKDGDGLAEINDSLSPGSLKKSLTDCLYTGISSGPNAW